MARSNEAGEARSGREIACVLGVLLMGLTSVGACVGDSGDRPEGEQAADAGVGRDADATDGSAAAATTGKTKPKRNSLAVSGWGRHSLHDFTLHDKQGREVVRLKSISGTTDVDALKRGTFRVKNAKIEGVELTMYRDESGKLSLVDAFKQQPPTVRHGMMVPPTPKHETEKHEKVPWLVEIGPIDVRDATLTIGFTKKPVIFHVDSAKITVERKENDAGPVIYIQEVQGHMLKPKPLPKPVRIAWANGLVNLVGKPLVNLAARTCIRKSELRIDAIVEARKEPVHLEGDSEGIGGALGRLGINIAAHVKKDKMSYEHEAVHIDGGPGCKDPETPPPSEKSKQAPKKPAAKQK